MHGSDDTPLVRPRIVFQNVIHHIPQWPGLIAPPAKDQNPATVDDGARFEVTTGVREAGDLRPFLGCGIKPVARVHIDLGLVVTVVATQRENLPIENCRAHMSARIWHISLASPFGSPIKRHAPMVARIRLAIGFVAAEVVEAAPQNRQTPASPRFRKRWSSCPRISGGVVFPNLIGDRPWVPPFEPTGKPDGLAVRRSV
jgi:hypothetical protein